jgi:oligopeptide transport system substrate-binding protein
VASKAAGWLISERWRARIIRGARPPRPSLLSAAALLALASCSGDSERPVIVNIMGTPSQLSDPQRYEMAPAAWAVFASTAQGLVAFDARGDVVAGLAESWIVVDNGKSYIFRLRRTNWANGDPVKADAVARLLQQRMRANPDLLAGLKPDVQAMTDRVIEIRLPTAFPAFIQLLAQPRLALMGRQGGTGPYAGAYRLQRLYLEPVADEPTADGAPATETRPRERRTLETGRPAVTVARFRAGRADLVLGGRFQHLLLIPPANLGSTDVRADPTPGLFGLAVVGKNSFLADQSVRDALSRAVDRAQLARDLNLQGWTTALNALPAQLDMASPPTAPDWSDQSLDQRITGARKAVNDWRSAHGEPPMLRIALPDGAGASLLFIRIARDFARLGLRVDRVGIDETADLRMVDAVAAFDSALWYLAQLDCGAGVACDAAASRQLDIARSAPDAATQADALSEAEQLIVAHGGYIPLGMPIRWALVSKRLNGFVPSPRALHPLNSLFRAPN